MPQLRAALRLDDVSILLGLYFLSRGSLSSTLASSLAVGAINIALVLLLALLALPQMRPENLFYANVPVLNGQAFEPSV